MLISALGLLRAYWLPLALFASAASLGVVAHEQHSTISLLRAQSAARESDLARERADWRNRIGSITSELKVDAAQESSALANSLADVERARDAAVRRMRDAEASARTALRPSANTPTACRDYEATPSQLSQSDAEFLIDLATEADAAVIERNSCVASYEAVRRSLSR